LFVSQYYEKLKKKKKEGIQRKEREIENTGAG
jgi:hypothetical protein